MDNTQLRKLYVNKILNKITKVDNQLKLLIEIDELLFNNNQVGGADGSGSASNIQGSIDDIEQKIEDYKKTIEQIKKTIPNKIKKITDFHQNKTNEIQALRADIALTQTAHNATISNITKNHQDAISIKDRQIRNLVNQIQELLDYTEEIHNDLQTLEGSLISK